MLHFDAGQYVYVRFSPPGGLWEGYLSETTMDEAGWFDSSCVAVDPAHQPAEPAPLYINQAQIEEEEEKDDDDDDWEEDEEGDYATTQDQQRPQLSRAKRQLPPPPPPVRSISLLGNAPGGNAPGAGAVQTEADAYGAQVNVYEDPSKVLARALLEEQAGTTTGAAQPPQQRPSAMSLEIPSTPDRNSAASNGVVFTPQTSARSSARTSARTSARGSALSLATAAAAGVSHHQHRPDGVQLSNAASNAWMEQQSWYVGGMSRNQIKWWGSNLSLRGPRGGFMVRIPDSRPNHLALMVKVSDSKVKNFLIKRSNGGFKLNSVWAQTMEDLVELLSSPAQNALPTPLLPGFFLKKDVAERRTKRTFDGKRSRTDGGTHAHARPTSNSSAASSAASSATSASSFSAVSSFTASSSASVRLGRKRNAVAIDVSPRKLDSHKKLRRPPSSPGTHTSAAAAAPPTVPTVALAAAAAAAAADALATATAAAASSGNVESAESEEAAAIAQMLARHNATLNGTLLSQTLTDAAKGAEGAGAPAPASNEGVSANGDGAAAAAAATTAATAAAVSHEIMFEEDAEVLNPPQMHIAVHGYTAMHLDELSFTKGSTIAVIEKPEGGWWKGTVDKKSGWFPANHASGEGGGGGAAVPAPAAVLLHVSENGAAEQATESTTDNVADITAPLLLAPPVGLSGIKVRSSMTMLLPPPPGFDSQSTTTDPEFHIAGAVTAISEN